MQKFAEFYRQSIFVKLYGNSNESTKGVPKASGMEPAQLSSLERHRMGAGLFMHRYKIPKTPTFLFMRNKDVQLQYTGEDPRVVASLPRLQLPSVEPPCAGTRKEKLDEAMQHCLLPEENPLHNATPFKRQIWLSKLGVS